MGEAAGNVFGPLDGGEPSGGLGQLTGTAIGGTNTFVSSVGSKDHGNYGFASGWVLGNDQTAGYKDFSAVTMMYAREYVYIPATFNCGRQYAQIPLMELWGGSQTTIMMGISNQSNNASPFHPDNWMLAFVGGGGAIFSTTGFSMGAWHYIELYWIAGSGANGGGTMKVDGTQVLSNLTLNHSAYTITRCYVGDNGVIGETLIPTGMSIYYDDAKGSTLGWIGPYNAGGWLNRGYWWNDPIGQR